MSEELQDLSFWSHRLTAFCHSSLTLSNPFISSFQVYNLNATYSLLIKKGSKYKWNLFELWPKQPSCLYNGWVLLHSMLPGESLLTRFLHVLCQHAELKMRSSIWGEVLLWLFSYALAPFCGWEESPWSLESAQGSSFVWHQKGFQFYCLKVSV